MYILYSTCVHRHTYTKYNYYFVKQMQSIQINIEVNKYTVMHKYTYLLFSLHWPSLLRTWTQYLHRYRIQCNAGIAAGRPYSVLIATDTADIVGLAQAQLHKSVQGWYTCVCSNRRRYRAGTATGAGTALVWLFKSAESKRLWHHRRLATGFRLLRRWG